MKKLNSLKKYSLKKETMSITKAGRATTYNAPNGQQCEDEVSGPPSNLFDDGGTIKC